MNFSTISLMASKKNQSLGLGKTFTSVALAIILMIAGQTSWGQSLTETFNYTAAGNLGGNTAASGTSNNNWTTHSNSQTGTITVVSGSLTFTGLNPSNNRINIPGNNTTTPRDINRPCGLAASQNTSYYSFLLNVTDATQLSASATFFTNGANGYFMHMSTTNGATAANFFGRISIRSVNAAANYRLGIADFGNTFTDQGTDLNFGTTYLVVVKYVFNSGGSDVATMWVNPSSVGGTEPAGGVTNNSSAGNIAAYNSSNTGICIRNSSNTPKADIDEIRVGTTYAQVTQQNVDGFIVSPEYGTHTDGQNQNTNGGNVTYMNWDNNNLYVGVSGANLAEGFVMYLDKDPQTPVDGGVNANGTLIGQNYDGANFANLPWRADLVMYVKNNYREYRTASGSNTWNTQVSGFGNYSDNAGTVREFSIPWSVIGGRPASFNFFSYNTSSGGFVYNTQPTANAGGTIGTSARYERYYTVSTTTIGSSTPPFSRNSYVFNNTADESGFGTINVYDFTMNTSGRLISKSGATTQNWNIAHNLVVGNGTIFFGSGGTNGAYGTVTVGGDLDIRGGTLDMDQTTGALTVSGNLSLTSGTLKLSGNSFGGGDLKLAGNWSRTSGTFTPQLRAVFFNGTAGNQTISATSGSESFDFLIVDKSAGNLQLNTSVNVNAATSNKFQIINTGGVDLNGNQLVFNGNGGNLFVNGARSITSTLANASIQFNGVSAVANNAGVGTLSIANNIITQLNGVIDFGNNITTLNGILEMEVNQGSSFVTNNSPIYGSGGSLRYMVAYTSALEWPSSNGPTNVSVYNGNTVTLSASRTVAGAVLLNGFILTNANTLSIATAGSIAPFNTGGWVRGNLQRGVATGTNTYLFPLGNNFRYTPASIAFSGVTNAGNLTFSIDGTNYPTQLDATKRVNIIWKGINSGISGFTYDATFSYDNTLLGAGTTEALLKPYKFDAPSTYSFPAHSIGSFSFTETGLTSFSEFGAGECGVIPVDPITGGGASICIGATQQLASTTPAGVWSSDAPLTASVNVTGLVTGNAAGTTTIRYTVTEPLSGCTGEATQSVTVLPDYTITSSAGSGGSISPNGVTTLCEGANQTYTITPADACHVIADVIVDGVSQGAVGTYTFTNVTANHTISASFSLITYTITVTAGANGSITPATGSVNCGDNATYTITADACYSIADVVVDGVSQGAVGTYTFTNVTAAHTISATFVLNTYTITVTAGANGSITPATGSVNCGDNATYTITADACYSIADVVVDGVSQGAVGTYTFTNVTAVHTISASFVLNTYTITVTAGANGSITPATGSVNCGDNATYTITADACYTIADVVVDGISQGAVGTYTFTNVTAAHTISATFILNTYTITVTAGANGSITPATGSVNCGDNATYTITADACYSIADVVVDGVSQGNVGTYTFTNVTANHTISATFSLNTYTITVTAGANGSITPVTGSVNCGDNATYTITADACYSIADVVVDGVSQGAVGTYTFTNVTATHTISATFVLNTYTITVTAGTGGTITPGTGSANCGDNATYTISPNSCYTSGDVIVDGVSQGAIGTYTFTNVTANHTISASFNLVTFTITATAGAGGSITPATGPVNCGDNATYTITPDACYSIADVVVDGVSQGAVGTYTFTNVTAAHTISATFVLNTYTITVTAGANGSITPATGSVNCGDNATYTITADACYSIADVVVDGVSQGAVGTYTFTNVTANHTISATFVLNTYTITVTAGANGSITPATGSVNCGDNATYTITADACYSISDVVVDGVSQGAVGTYTFTNVTANHTISATFVQNTYTITVIQGANGIITPGTSVVNCGNNISFFYQADPCYQFVNWIVDGIAQPGMGSYTFNVTANHTISAAFALNTYTISATAGANGSITPATGSVNCGDNATYTITPDACYAIADVIVDGVSQGAVGTYTFTNVTANHTISATFVPTTYTITVTAGANGSITPGTGSVNCGDNATYTITSDACYSIADVVVDGVSQGAVGTYTFTNVTANHTISATFVITTYTITVTAGANGSITPATGSVNCGDNATYTITADACYSIADVVVDGVSQGAVGTYTFTNVTANHTISATFVLNTYTITVTAGPNGSITPATGSVNCGDNATYTITPNACYSIADVIVDGVSQGAVGTYTFTNVTANHTISATFVLNTYTITVTAGANGSISPATGSVNCGDNATYTITANACYSIADVVVDGVSQGAVGTYTFTNVTANHTISATFVITTYTISVTSGANGSITPGTGSVNCGSNATYTITPIACYHVANVIVDGVSQGAVTTYTFTNVTANHTISATFAINTPLAAPVVTGPINVCPYIGTGDQVTYTATSAGATGFTWVIPPTNVTIISGQGTANLTVTFQNGFAAQANKQLRVTATSACGNSPLTIYYLLVQIPSTPQPIVGNTNVCPIIGTANTYSYTIPSVPGATSYVWNAQPVNAVITHPNGPGVNDTTVNVSFTNSFTSSSITVASANGCGTSSARSLALIKTNPSQPGLISGPTNACAYMAPGGTVATYSILPVSGATSYTWTVPAGAIGVTPQGTTSISFTYPNSFVSGTVSVTATNGCGTGVARSLSISKLAPSTPSVIDVIQVAPCPDRIYTYTLSAMPANATSVQWTVPAGGTITNGQGTTSITVSYTAASVNGNVTAQALNNCGSSTIRISAVKLGSCQLERAITTKGTTVPATTASVESMQVKLFPNPTVSDFKLQVVTAGKQTINVRIMDAQGRSIKTFVAMPYQTINVGADLKAGAYLMEVRQGNEVKVSKLLKF